MQVPFDGHVRELTLIRNRIRRLYGRGQISMETHNKATDLVEQLEEVFEEAKTPEPEES